MSDDKKFKETIAEATCIAIARLLLREGYIDTHTYNGLVRKLKLKTPINN